MGARDAGSAGVLALFALFALVQSLRLDVGTVTRPGPGFFPLVLSIVLLLVGVALFGAAWRRRFEASPTAAVDDWPGATGPARRGALVATVVGLAVYVAIFERAGFVLATTALIAVLFAAVARYPWLMSLAAAILITLLARLVFDTWLQVRLPPGLLGR
jgi:hypothetical protein